MQSNLTLGEAATAIGVSPDTLRRWDRAGKLKTFRGHRALQSDHKKAIVTLVEGHTIDLATGL